MARDPRTALTARAQQWLLQWARRSIQCKLTAEPIDTAVEHPVGVEEPRACFVSLHTNAGALRGCIGTFDDSPPLCDNVQAMAVAAATNDYRFSRLTIDELASCVIEISALTPRVAITPEQVVVGEHGLWVARAGHHGVLLPQVATSHGWDSETFLAHTCGKAGLPHDAWRDPETRIEAFSAEVFGER